MSLLSRDEILVLFTEVAEELAAAGTRGHLFVVGGAAMALAYGRERLTRDIDGVYEPKSVVHDAAVRVGRRHGLPDDWLNDAVKGFMHGADPNATTVFDRPGLAVQVASPQYLFVLKAMAARLERDADDLVTLYRLCGFASVDAALDAVVEAVPSQLLSPKTEFFIRELLGDVDTG